jgi:hypothetical protein
MLRCVAFVSTDVSEELSASIIWVKRIGELGTTLAVTSNYFTNSCHPNDGGDNFLRNVVSYKSHTALTSQKTPFFVYSLVLHLDPSAVM